MQADNAKVGLIIFLLSFFLIYGGLHLYIFFKIKNALQMGPTVKLCLIFFMALMVVAPVVIRLAERGGYELMARLFSYTGYAWTGLAFLFFSMAMLLDFYRYSLKLSGIILNKDLSLLMVSPFTVFMSSLLVAVTISAYGYFEARHIRTERIVIRSSKIPETLGRLKIVQISDVHLGLIVREKRLDKILEQVRRENPDILVSTGDLVDGQICKLDEILKMFNNINPQYGKFAVTGNHEFYAGLRQALACTQQAGFTMLRGESIIIDELISIAGVDDPAGRFYGGSRGIEEPALLSPLPRDTFTLLLKHQPEIDKNSLGFFDLQLSGHTHRGQIYPFALITRMRYPFNSGFFNLPHNTRLYVSRGSGTWGPPFRFLSPPEVTVIEVVHGSKH